MDELRSRVEAAVEASGAQIGVAISHLESGEDYMLNADTPVPLASVVKIPVVIHNDANDMIGIVLIQQPSHRIGQERIRPADTQDRGDFGTALIRRGRLLPAPQSRQVAERHQPLDDDQSQQNPEQSDGKLSHG